MKNTNEAERILRNAEVEATVNCVGIAITAIRSVKDCEGCIFRTENKADTCRFKTSCFAHERPDRESVIFKSGKKQTNYRNGEQYHSTRNT